MASLLDVCTARVVLCADCCAHSKADRLSIACPWPCLEAVVWVPLLGCVVAAAMANACPAASSGRVWLSLELWLSLGCSCS